MTGPYEDIIHLSHPVSAVHPRMPAISRAAQFSPFAALTGFESVIEETARLTEDRIELSENAIADLDFKLNILANRIADHPEVTLTYYMPDNRKKGGAYVTANGTLKKLDDYERALLLTNGQRIAIEDILEIECELFEGLI